MIRWSVFFDDGVGGSVVAEDGAASGAFSVAFSVVRRPSAVWDVLVDVGLEQTLLLGGSFLRRLSVGNILALLVLCAVSLKVRVLEVLLEGRNERHRGLVSAEQTGTQSCGTQARKQEKSGARA